MLIVLVGLVILNFLFSVEIWGCLSFGNFAVDMVKCVTPELMDVPTWRW